MNFNNNSVCGAIEVLLVRYNPSLGCLCRAITRMRHMLKEALANMKMSGPAVL